jgi:TM2 domain-containing membrane protein YozV
MTDNEQYSDRSWIVTLILCIFGGFTGIHRLYTGHVILAFLYSITVGFFLIGYIFDLISLITGNYRDVNDRRLC